MASFGYSIGDILSLTKLAWDVVQNSRKACGEYNELTQQVTSFNTVLGQIQNEVRKSESLLTVPNRKAELDIILLPCQTVLDTLNGILQKYNALPIADKPHGGLAVFYQRLRFGNGEMQDLGTLREKMTACMSLIALYQNMLFFGRMEENYGDLKFIMLAVHDEITRQQTAPVNGREGSILTTYGDDDKTAWKDFRRSLINKGFNSQLLEKNKDTILGLLMNDDSFETASIVTPDSKDPTAVGSELDLFGAEEKRPRIRRPDGYRQCSASVMDKWSLGTFRVLRPRELRFEVVFEAPVLFVAHPTNMKGPIPSKPVHSIDGSPESYEDTWTRCSSEEMEIKRGVSIAMAGERATWVALIRTLQLMECESRKYDVEKRITAMDIKCRQPIYTLCVQLQRKKSSWDFVPRSVNKPFAITTISHLIEICATLGLRWKTFHEKTWQIRAEGSGCCLTTTLVTGLGIMATFIAPESWSLPQRRVIPSDLVTDYCFGVVPSIHTAPNLKNLKFGREVTSTLELLGCSKGTIEKYHCRRHSHRFSLESLHKVKRFLPEDEWQLWRTYSKGHRKARCKVAKCLNWKPVAFEIIGMLGRPVRIRGSCFTRLPNPTAERPCSLSINILYRLLEAFAMTIEDLTPLSQSLNHWRNVKTVWPQQQFYEKHDISISAKEFLHDLLDSCTEYLLSQPLHSIHGVISAHLTAVIDHLNSPDSIFDNDFAELAGKSDYAADLVSTYSNEILPVVISKGPLASKRMSQNDSKGSRDFDQLEMTEADLNKLEREGLERKTIWCTLVIRMLCWLLLHDFHPDDVNIVPSELKGSQMPVYIG